MYVHASLGTYHDRHALFLGLPLFAAVMALRCAVLAVLTLNNILVHTVLLLLPYSGTGYRLSQSSLPEQKSKELNTAV